MIHLSETNGVTVVRMEHGKVQALDIELLADLTSTFERLSASSPNAVVLTGSGSSFSAGVDLLRLLDQGVPYVREFFPALCRGLQTMFAFPRPLVAAVNGHAIAGGAIMACACDYRIMTDGGARIGVPELLVGVAFPAIVVETLRFALPAEHLQEIVYLGQTYPADRARSMGFVDELVPSETLVPRAVEIASRLGAAPRFAFEIGKRQLREPYLERARQFEVSHGEAVFEQWLSPATHDFIRAYLDKTLKRK